VDASTSEQSGARQSIAGIVDGEENRCLPAVARQHVRRYFQQRSASCQGQFQGQKWGQAGSA
jgi:hypothetical protein